MSTLANSIMFVCTANICRSPVADEIFSREIGAWLASTDFSLEIISRGTHAQAGDDRCHVASERFEIDEPGVSALFKGAEPESQGLILTMEQQQMAFLVQSYPKFRSRIFTLPQAVEIAEKIHAGILDGSLFTSVDPEMGLQFVAPPMPQEISERWAWLVNELDANRGLIATTKSILTSGDFDIADAHQPDGPTHELALDLIDENVKALATLIQAILGVHEFSEVRSA
jgi:protein-tyrosine-phosphatase